MKHASVQYAQPYMRYSQRPATPSTKQQCIAHSRTNNVQGCTHAVSAPESGCSSSKPSLQHPCTALQTQNSSRPFPSLCAHTYNCTHTPSATTKPPASAAINAPNVTPALQSDAATQARKAHCRLNNLLVINQCTRSTTSAVRNAHGAAPCFAVP
jgi:hypothetical protein